jgi:hypothetical protein
LLQLPGCAVAFISVAFGTWWAGKYNGRAIAIIALIIPTLIGGALMAWLPPDNKGGLLTGNFLTNSVGASMNSIPASHKNNANFTSVTSALQLDHREL